MRNVLVPDGVQFVMGASATEAYRNIVTSPKGVFNVQRLVQVADKVKDEHQRFFAYNILGVRIKEERGLICNGRYNTTFFVLRVKAVTIIVDVAFQGWGIEGIFGFLSVHFLPSVSCTIKYICPTNVVPFLRPWP